MNSYKVNYYDREYEAQTICVTATNAFDARNETFLTIPWLKENPHRIYSITYYVDRLYQSDGSIH